MEGGGHPRPLVNDVHQTPIDDVGSFCPQNKISDNTEQKIPQKNHTVQTLTFSGGEGGGSTMSPGNKFSSAVESPPPPCEADTDGGGRANWTRFFEPRDGLPSPSRSGDELRRMPRGFCWDTDTLRSRSRWGRGAEEEAVSWAWRALFDDVRGHVLGRCVRSVLEENDARCVIEDEEAAVAESSAVFSDQKPPPSGTGAETDAEICGALVKRVSGDER